jgi:hypothetical protein
VSQTEDPDVTSSGVPLPMSDARRRALVQAARAAHIFAPLYAHTKTARYKTTRSRLENSLVDTSDITPEDAPLSDAYRKKMQGEARHFYRHAVHEPRGEAYHDMIRSANKQSRGMDRFTLGATTLLPLLGLGVIHNENARSDKFIKDLEKQMRAQYGLPFNDKHVPGAWERFKRHAPYVALGGLGAGALINLRRASKDKDIRRAARDPEYAEALRRELAREASHEKEKKASLVAAAPLIGGIIGAGLGYRQGGLKGALMGLGTGAGIGKALGDKLPTPTAAPAAPAAPAAMT